MSRGYRLFLLAGLAAFLSGCTATDTADLTNALATFAADFTRQLLAAALL